MPPNVAAETAFLNDTVFANHVPPVSVKDEGDTMVLSVPGARVTAWAIPLAQRLFVYWGHLP